MGAAWLHAEGELDVASVAEFDRTLRAAQEAVSLVAVDLQDLQFIDSSGVHALVDASLRAMLDGRRLVITNASPHVVRILRLTGAAPAIELLTTVPAPDPSRPRLFLVEPLDS